MNRIVLTRSISPVIPIIGIPLKGFNNIFIATKTNCGCFLRASYRMVRCSRTSNRQIEDKAKDVTFYIGNYLNTMLSDLADLCVEGYSSIECDCPVPDIVAFVMGSTEVMINMLRVKRIEYEDYLKVFAALDGKFWQVEPSYIAALRCAYMFQEACICRDVDDIVRLGNIQAAINPIGEIPCSTSNTCLEVHSPFDTPTTSYILKFTSHVASLVAQDIVNDKRISEQTLKHLHLLYGIETTLVLETHNATDLELGNMLRLKPIADISSVRLYTIEIQ
uniref:Uncharacterized protein n=1 Tax=Ignisphaera aggregans TaxID=334771 RepID=A0A7C2VHF5_9CREN